MKGLAQDEGFSLLEVLISVAIFALAAGALFPLFGATPGRVAQAHDRAEALAVAEAKLEELAMAFPNSSLPEEGISGKWRWVRSAERYTDDPNPGGSKGYLYTVTSEVFGSVPEPVVVLETIIWRAN